MTHPLRGAIAAALVAAVPAFALAQVSAAASAPASAPARNAASAAPAAYKSAFDGYRRFDEPKVQPWREANDNVGRIGGWRAYARESAGDDSHQGHGDQAMPKKP